MKWIDRLKQILEYDLFQISGEAITSIQLANAAMILIVTLYIARLARRLGEKHLPTYLPVQTGGLSPLIRLIQYAVWMSGLFLSSKALNLADRVEGFLFYRFFDIGGKPITPIQLVMVVVTIVVTIYIARSLRWLCQERLRHRLPVDAEALYPLVRLTQYSVWVIGGLISLKVLNIDLTGIAVLAGGLGVGIGFGLQNIASNFVAGLILLFERPIKVKDFVAVENIEGTVTDINSRATTIVSNDNITIIVPNSQFINNAVINWSHGEPNVRIHAPVGVAYGSDIELVRRTLLEVAAEIKGVLPSPPAKVRFLGFGDSSLNFDLLVWTDQPARHYDLESELNFAIDAAFRRNGVHIPFPQRDLHIKSADELAKALAKVPMS